MGIAKELNQLCYNLTGEYSEQTTARGVLNDLIEKLSGKASGEVDLSNAVNKAADAVKGSSEVVWKYLTIIPPNVITDVTIPDGVTEIGERGFHSCSLLTKVTAPESVKKIGDQAFLNSPLEKISFPGAEYIGMDAFANTATFTTTEGIFPKVKEINSRAFKHTTLTVFSFPEVVRIEGSATQGCTGITEISMPKCEYIGMGNFSSLTLSNPLELPECREIEMGGFGALNCSRIDLPKIEKIGGNSFASCTFEALILSNPKKVCELGANCFKNATQDDTHGWIYVPKHLLKQYKKEWSDLAERIRAIEDYPEIME